MTVKKIILNWETNYRLIAKNEKGVSTRFDASPEFGGEETALTPMETLLSCLAACTSYDVLIILKKKRQQIKAYAVEAIAEKRDDPPPHIYTKIHLKYLIKGENLSQEAVKRAIDLSMDKYCSVAAMIKQTAEISYSYEIQKV